jgi:hypothetical protein
MHTSWPGIRRAVAAGACGILLAAVPVAVAARPAPAGDQPDGATRAVTLPTGDRLLVGTDPAGRLLVTPARPGSGPYLTERVAGQDYVIPLDALRRRGAALDPADFDVTTLLGGATPAGVHPDYPMRTLTLNVVDDAGQPVEAASLTVVNVDDSTRYSGFVTVQGGQARISVPDGHYTAMVNANVFDDSGLTATELAFTDFTVAGAPATASLDLRTATGTVTVGDPPRPADLLGQDLTWYRGSDDGHGAIVGVVGLPAGTAIRLGDSPASVGVQHFYVHDRFESDGATDPYAYDVEFPTDGALSGPLRYRIAGSDLAAVDTGYHSDVPGRVGAATMFGMLGWEFFQARTTYPVTRPLRRTEYLTGDPDIAYAGFLLTSNDAAGETWRGGYERYRAGQRAAVDWLAGPIVPGLPADTGTGDYQCPACREGDTLSIDLSPVTDSEPDHYGYLAPSGDGVTSSSRFQLYQGNRRLADLADATGADVAVGPDPAGYRVVYDQTRRSTATAQSTTSHTEWTFRSRHSGATTVPDRWFCGTAGITTDCSPVPLLTLGYDLPAALDGTVPAGTGTLTLTVGHTSGTPDVAVRSATVAVSYDGGATWTPVPVTPLGANRYTAGWDGTAGQTVSLAVTATDDDGDTVTQTVTDAVTVA